MSSPPPLGTSASALGVVQGVAWELGPAARPPEVLVNSGRNTLLRKLGACLPA